MAVELPSARQEGVATSQLQRKRTPAGLLQTIHDHSIRPSPRRRAALLAALLFGAGTPPAKMLLADIDPRLLAGLLCLGPGLGLTLWRVLRRSERLARLAPGEGPWLAGAVLFGGVIGPVLLMAGLAGMPASGAALLRNAEGVFTAAIAWVVFRENVETVASSSACSSSWPARWC